MANAIFSFFADRQTKLNWETWGVKNKPAN
jgi:hypothetical protein